VIFKDLLPPMTPDDVDLRDLWRDTKDPNDKRGFDKWCRDNGIISPQRRRTFGRRETHYRERNVNNCEGMSR
jgi:hypothetical protein